MTALKKLKQKWKYVLDNLQNAHPTDLAWFCFLINLLSFYVNIQNDLYSHMCSLLSKEPQIHELI